MTAETLSANDPVLIRARRLRVVRERRPILDEIDLELRPAQLLTLVGPNGAGKSTLLKVLIGLVPLTGGELIRRPGLRVAYVPQYFRLEPTLPMTVGRFLSLQLARPRLSVAEVSAEFRIRHLLERPMQGLSGGESRRVLLARALLREPDLLALDEPAAGLDVPGQGEIYELIQAVRERRGCSVLVVSHDLHLVMATTDQVLCLNEGHILCRGAPESVLAHPEYQTLFGPHLARATAVYAHHHHGPECRH